MKKIYHLFTLAALAAVFTSCHPLDKTYKSLDGLGKPAQTLNYTLQASDYTLLPSTVAAYKSLSFATSTDANTNIPTILNYKFFDYGDGSNANITYNVTAPGSIKLADSVSKDVNYTLTNADYLLLPGNKYTDFTIAQTLSWLPYKYPSAVANQEAVLTFNYYNSTTTVQTFAFLYLNGAWQQIYLLSAAQYVAVGRGGYNEFTSADDATLISYLNAILKADLSVSLTAKTGQIEYVSFLYYSATKVTSQRVIPLVFDGTNWGTANTTATLPFAKSSGKWIADPTVYYTLTTADTKLIGNPTGTNNQTIGTTAERANLYQYGDFSGWAQTDIQNALILVLTTDFPNPKVNVDYKVTYLLYSGGKDVPTVVPFIYNGTSWSVSTK